MRDDGAEVGGSPQLNLRQLAPVGFEDALDALAHWVPGVGSEREAVRFFAVDACAKPASRDGAVWADALDDIPETFDGAGILTRHVHSAVVKGVGQFGITYS